MRVHDGFRSGAGRLFARPCRCAGVGVDRAPDQADAKLRHLRADAPAGRGAAATEPTAAAAGLRDWQPRMATSARADQVARLAATGGPAPLPIAQNLGAIV